MQSAAVTRRRERLEKILKRLGFVDDTFSGKLELNFYKGELSKKIKKADTIEM